MRRRKPKEGEVVKIDLGDGTHAYACASYFPLMVFFEGTSSNELSLDQVRQLPVAFKIWTESEAVQTGRWPVIGRIDLPPEFREEPFFWKQDLISGRLALHHSSFKGTNYERPATLAECEGLERAAVWAYEHVEDRLRDRRDGRENRWSRQLSIKREKIPT